MAQFLIKSILLLEKHNAVDLYLYPVSGAYARLSSLGVRLLCSSSRLAFVISSLSSSTQHETNVLRRLDRRQNLIKSDPLATQLGDLLDHQWTIGDLGDMGMLEYCNKRDVIHGGLSPENLLLNVHSNPLMRDSVLAFFLKRHFRGFKP